MNSRNNNLRLRYSGLFFKLAFAFLLIILPLSILSLTLNYSSSKTVKSQIEQSLEYRLNTFVSGIDADFRRIMRLHNELMADSDLLVLSSSRNQLSDYMYSKAVLRVQEKLRLLQASSLYLDDVHVYLPNIKRSISTRGFAALPSDNEIQALKHSTLSSPIVFNDNQYLIGGFFPESYGIDNRIQDPFIILKMSLSEKLIQQSLEELYVTDLGGSMLLHGDQQWMIVSGNQDVTEKIIHFETLPPLALSLEQEQAGNVSVAIDGVKYKVFFEKSTALGANTVVFLPEDEILDPIKKYRYWFWIFMITSILVVIFFSYWIYRIIHLPIQRMVRAFFKLEKGNLNITLKHSRNDEFAYLYEQFNVMSSKLQQLVHEVYEEKIRSQRAELKQLQSQINPHFLYNSYFILHRVAQLHDYETMIRLTRHLGEYFRYITRNGLDEISLGDEFRHTKSYIEIQMLRYSRRIQTIYDEVPLPCKEVMVPRLILQPVLENAYEHGLKDKVSGGIVRISMTLMEQTVNIYVEDNGDDLTDEEIEQLSNELQRGENVETTGMYNVHRRLQLKYGVQYGLAIERSAMGGLQVHYRIPLKQEIDDEQAADH